MLLRNKDYSNNRFLTDNKRRKGALKLTLRRNPCRIIFLANLIFLLLFLVALFFAVKYFSDFSIKLDTFAREDKVIKNLGSQAVSMSECTFEIDSSNNRTKTFYDTSKCKNYRRGSDKFILSRHLTRIQLMNVTEFVVPSICSSLVELMDCHESISSVTVSKKDFRTNITECIGLGYNYTYSKNSPATVWAPSINSTAIENYRNRVVFANDLILRCPVCCPESHPFGFNGYGNYTKLSTTHRGWPVDYEFCKSTINATSFERPPDSLMFEMIDQHSYTDVVEIVTTPRPPDEVY